VRKEKRGKRGERNEATSCEPGTGRLSAHSSALPSMFPPSAQKGGKRQLGLMAADTDTSYLLGHIQGCCPQSLVCPLLREELPRIMPPPHEPLSTGCLLGDIGDFLVDVLVVTSELAQVLVKGHRIRNHTTRLLSVLSGEPDLRTTDYLDDKHEALKSVTIRTPLLHNNPSLIPISTASDKSLPTFVRLETRSTAFGRAHRRSLRTSLQTTGRPTLLGQRHWPSANPRLHRFLVAFLQ